ncbi:MAG: cadherin-like beta sandwich domain-containing protein, partial [Myxococcales bacterium]|nr:cadherin-like beta sandwich domain-containing protein [Myxococcales bacterium]
MNDNFAPRRGLAPCIALAVFLVGAGCGDEAVAPTDRDASPMDATAASPDGSPNDLDGGGEACPPWAILIGDECGLGLLDLQTSRGKWATSFAPDVLRYEVQTALDAESFSITAEAPETTTLLVNGEVVNSGEASAPIPLSGLSTSAGVVVAHDADMVGYLVEVIRAQVLTAPSVKLGDRYGSALAIAGGVLAIGTDAGEISGNDNTGIVHIYGRE